MRKLLYQAGDLLQEMFYVYRENVFDKLIVNIEHKDGKMYIYEGVYGRLQNNFDLLEPFPHHLVSNEEDKHAILAHLSCGEAVGWMNELIEHVLKDIASELEEYSIIFKNSKRTLVAVAITGREDTYTYQHEIIQVTLKQSGEQYVLDLAGAQYGYHDTVIPSSTYFSSRVASIEARNPMGCMRRWYMQKLQAAGTRTSDLVVGVIALNRRASQTLKGIIVRWEKVYGRSMKEILGESQDFVKVKNELPAALGNVLKEFLEEIRNHEEAKKNGSSGGTGS
ncbi:hypothetical protein EG329_001712 [Mollisiaceae sp. DMI_Dod_QoI]|nr:hypothetical protein EG329_001712 [Helotiales sp. DMI_Dod_QoI]